MQNYLKKIDKSCSYLIAHFKEGSKIVVGIPHHNPYGMPNMRCSPQRVADENAALIGEIIAKELESTFIFACNYFLDSNKSRCSDYFKALLERNPDYLIEIHGNLRDMLEPRTSMSFLYL